MSGFEIQKAVFAALAADATLTALGAEITDFGPRPDDGAAAFPYVEVGSILLAEMDTKNTNGFDAALRIHSYSNTGSAKQCRDIQSAIYAVLHKSEIPALGYNTVLMYRQDSDVMRTSTGAFHGVCDYRALFDAN